MERIGPYEIVQVLGEGGMGIVYKARDEALGRLVAIKTLLPNRATDVQLRRRLIAEARALGALTPHPNVVGVYGFIPERLAIVMEFVEGETLSELLDRRAKLPLGEVMAIAKQLLDALQHVHDQKVVHRDVKPSNIMISGGRVKLADFGLALLAGEPRLTVPLGVLGTPAYMSPEQMNGDELDARTDVYSAALVLYQMLAGQLPFIGNFRQRLYGPPSMQALGPDVPAGVSEALSIALQPGRDERFRSAAEFRAALLDGVKGFIPAQPERIDEDITPIADPPRPPVWYSRPAIWGVIALVLGFVAAAARLHYIAGLPILIAQMEAPRLKLPVETRPQKTETQQPPANAIKKPKPVVPLDQSTVVKPPVPAPVTADLQFLRAEIARGLTSAQNAINDHNYTAALIALGIVDSNIRQSPASFIPESSQLDDLRVRANQGIDEEKKLAPWRSKIVAIEEHLTSPRLYPLAMVDADGLRNNQDAPEDIRARAAELYAQAKAIFDSKKQGFQEGKTENRLLDGSPAPPKKKP